METETRFRFYSRKLNDAMETETRFVSTAICTCLNIRKGQAMVCPIVEQILKVHAMVVTIIIIKFSPRYLLGMACTSGHHD